MKKKDNSVYSSKVKFIESKLSDYKDMISRHNKCGLFDEAKYFELFAQRICGVLFEQTFHNLNELKSNYPYVDLVSEDGKTFVQVSTTNEDSIQKKIEGTISKIKAKRKEEKLLEIEKLKFFLLKDAELDTINPESIDGVNFDKNQDIITITSIINKLESSETLLDSLSKHFKKEDEWLENIDSKLSDVLINQKEAEFSFIPSKIGDYHIDRVLLRNEILRSDKKFILISGDPGSGKSAIAKEALENEKNVIVLRADNFQESGDPLSFYGFKIEEAVSLLKNEKLTILVDSLERIDNNENKKVVFSKLLNICKKTEGIKVFITCRTDNLSSFDQIITSFDFDKIEVGYLSDDEIKGIKNHFPELKDLDAAYSSILSNPFYLSLIVENKFNLKDSADEKQLRNEIFDECICLKSKGKKDGKNLNKVRKVALGLATGRINTIKDYDALEYLHRNKVITSYTTNIHFTHDIFSDICFEKILDEEYEKSKGNLKTFFSRIEKHGEQVYRKYLLWINNSLVNKDNYETFLVGTLNGEFRFFTELTSIAILSTKRENKLISQYISGLDNGKIKQLIQIANNYCFTLDCKKKIDNDNSSSLTLKPYGYGRVCLFNVVSERFEEFDLEEYGLFKMVTDLNKYNVLDKENITKLVSLTTKMITIYVKNECDIEKYVGKLFNIIFHYQEESSDWFDGFVSQIVNEYYTNDDYRNRSIIENLLGFHVDRLYPITEIADTLCGLAFKFWTEDPEDKTHSSWKRNSLNGFDRMGFSKNIDDIGRNSIPLCSSFFCWLCSGSILKALSFYIKLFNHVAEKGIQSGKFRKKDIEIFDPALKNKKSFHYVEELFYSGFADKPNLPNLFSDIPYCLKFMLSDFIKRISKEKAIEYLHSIKTIITETSNNIGPFSLLVYLWHKHMDIVPAYCAELLLSEELIDLDRGRQTLNGSNPLMAALENRMLAGVGMPGINIHRYKTEDDYSLLSLFATIEDEDTRNKIIDKCREIGNENLALLLAAANKAAAMTDKIINPLKNLPEEKKKPTTIEDFRVQIRTSKQDNLPYEIKMICDVGLPNFYACLLCFDEASEDEVLESCSYLLPNLKATLNHEDVLKFDYNLLPLVIKRCFEIKDNGFVDSFSQLVIDAMLSYSSGPQELLISRIVAEQVKKDKDYLSQVIKAVLGIAKDVYDHNAYNYALCGLKGPYVGGYDNRYAYYDKDITLSGKTPYVSKIDDIRKGFLSNEEELKFDIDIDCYDIATLNRLIPLLAGDDGFKKLIRKIVTRAMELESNKPKRTYGYDYFDFVGESLKLISDEGFDSFVVDVLFDYIEENKLSREMIGNLTDILSHMTTGYLTSENKNKHRSVLEKIKGKIEDLKDKETKERLSVVLLFSTSYERNSIQKDKVELSTIDLMYLNGLFTKYGKFNPGALLHVIKAIGILRCLPHLLSSIVTSIVNVKSDDYLLRDDGCLKIIKDIIHTAYFSYKDTIKRNTNYDDEYRKLLAWSKDKSIMNAPIMYLWYVSS